jgi:hypothetical protein
MISGTVVSMIVILLVVVVGVFLLRAFIKWILSKTKDKL